MAELMNGCTNERQKSKLMECDQKKKFAKPLKPEVPISEGEWHHPFTRGQRRFRNYPSALEHRAQVSKGLRGRVRTGKTLC